MTQNASQPPSPGTPAPSSRFQWTKTTAIQLMAALVGVVLSVIAIYLYVNSPKPPSLVTAEETRMYDLGTQWAQGYAEALKVNNPDQNVLNSLYGACVVYTDNRVVPQYGQTAATSWLSGCLAYTRQQQFEITAASSAPTTSATN